MNNTGQCGKTFFLTGITGAIGSWLACDLVDAGHSIIALVRAADWTNAEGQVVEAITRIGRQIDSGRLSLYPGDLLELDSSLELIAPLARKASAVIHCAAATFLADSDDVRMSRANVGGTRSVLQLAKALRVPIVHLSTAYIAGKRTGIVMEDELNVGQSFNSSYERSKCEAETIVRDWSQEESLPHIILRPSIVMGASSTGAIMRFNAMYEFIRMLDLIVPHLSSEDYVLIPARGDVTKNMVPLDYVSRTLMYLLTTNNFGTYHLTNPNPITLTELAEVLSAAFMVRQYRIDAMAAPTQDSAVQAIMSRYMDYLLKEPKFDRTNVDHALIGADIEFPAMNAAYFSRILEYARTARWGALSRNRRRRQSKRIRIDGNRVDSSKSCRDPSCGNIRLVKT